MAKPKTSGARLPNYQRAVIVAEKLKNYLLHPIKSKGKVEFFNSLGYRMQNFRRLKSDIQKGLKNNPAVPREDEKVNKYGHKAYSVNMVLGIDKKARVVTGWQIDKGDNKPRFITAMPAKKKKEKRME
jgi:hypothetical protein